MKVPNRMDRPTQYELNDYRNGDNLIITWSGGNKGIWTVREVNGEKYVYPEHLQKYKDVEYREKLIQSSIERLKDDYVWSVEKYVV